MANIDTTIEIEKAYIKDKLTYKKKHSKKTEYFYDIKIPPQYGNFSNKYVVALIYPFNYNATPEAEEKSEFKISWGDGTESTIKNEYVNMFNIHYDKIKPFISVDGLNDFKLRKVSEKIKVGKEYKNLLFHEYDISGNIFTSSNADTVRISIVSDEIVIPVAINIRSIANIRPYVAGGNLNLPYPDSDSFGIDTSNKIRNIMNVISCVAVSVGGEFPPNLIGLPTEEYRDDFSRVFERGIYHPLDQKIEHIKNGNAGIDSEILTTFNRNDKGNIADYKSPSSMSIYALTGNNRFINKEIVDSIGTANRVPIPIQAILCSGTKDYSNSTSLKATGLTINPVIAPALVNKGVNVNNSLIYISLTTDNTKDRDEIHAVLNPFSEIISVIQDNKGEYSLFKNIKTTETWGFFCGFFTYWLHNFTRNGQIFKSFRSPWLVPNELYNFTKSIPTSVTKMKCVFRCPQGLPMITNKHSILDAIPKTVEEIENLVVFSNFNFYTSGFRAYRNANQYSESEAYDSRYRIKCFDNDDGSSHSYKNSNLRVIKNMVFGCDLYPEPVRLSENTWSTNFDGVSLLYALNSLEKVDGVFTYCRFKDVGYMRVRDICQRPDKSKYEDPSKVAYKPIDLSRVMHWCDIINELAEDSETDPVATNPFNGSMVTKQRNSWNTCPNYKYRDFYNKMTNDTTYDSDKMPTFIFGK